MSTSDHHADSTKEPMRERLLVAGRLEQIQTLLTDLLINEDYVSDDDGSGKVILDIRALVKKAKARIDEIERDPDFLQHCPRAIKLLHNITRAIDHRQEGGCNKPATINEELAPLIRLISSLKDSEIQTPLTFRHWREPPNFSERQLLVLQIIRDNPGFLGKEILHCLEKNHGIKVAPATLTSEYIPKLRKYYEIPNRSGYRIVE